MIHSRRHAFLTSAVALLAAGTGLLILAECFIKDSKPQIPPRSTQVQIDFGECPAADAVLQPVMSVSAERPRVVENSYKFLKTKYRYVGPLGSAAIIETLSSGKQKNYYCGMELEENVSISEIRARSVVLDTPDGQIALVSGNTAAGTSDINTTAETSLDTATPGMTEFQKRIGWQQNNTNEWSISQSKLFEYYTEVLARKERIGAVFDTLEPLRNETGKIEGYKVNIVGEKDFFNAVNFKQGDIVRSVNGIPMTNRRAAEKLVLRFATKDLEFVVIDMERDGAKIQQIYYIDP